MFEFVYLSRLQERKNTVQHLNEMQYKLMSPKPPVILLIMSCAGLQT